MDIAHQPIEMQSKEVLAYLPKSLLAVLFSSVAVGRQQRPYRDLGIAVAAYQALTANDKALVSALADRIGQAIDLIDLKVVLTPLSRMYVYKPHFDKQTLLISFRHPQILNDGWNRL